MNFLASFPAPLATFLEVWPRLFVSAAILGWVAWSSRAAASRLIGRAGTDVTICAVAILGVCCVLVPALALGAFSLLHDWTWAAGVVAAAALLREWSRRRPGPALPGDREDPPPSPVFLIALAGLVIGRAVYGLRNPPADIDSLLYHLPMVAHWAQSGALGAPSNDNPVFGIFYPGNGELLQLWAVFSAGRETLMSWVGILALGALGLALRPLCLLSGASAVMAETMTILLCAAPGVLQLTLGTGVDLIVAASFAIALLFATRFRCTGSSGDLVIMLCAAGIVAGTKTTGLALALVLIAVWGVGAGGRERWRVFAERRASLIVALLAGGFWYLRNLLATGNPIFPAPVQLGGLDLPGIMNMEIVRRTSQISMWLEGHAGHLTIPNLWQFFGGAIALWGIGVVALMYRSRLARRARGPAPATTLAKDSAGAASRASMWLLGAVALSCLALILLAPYSGATRPAIGVRPPVLTPANLRYLIPVAIAIVPLVAAGLTVFRWPIVIVIASAAAALAGLRPFLGHVVPGIVLAAGIAVLAHLVQRRTSWSAATRMAISAIAVATLTAAAVAAVDPMRERLTAEVNDSYRSRHEQLPDAMIRTLRSEAAGRTIACVNVPLWPYYGRDFSGRPRYVPANMTWSEADRPYRFLFDAKAPPDRLQWFDNLTRSGAAFVVVGPGREGCDQPAIEATWCAEAPERFEPVADEACVRAFRVRAGSD